MDPTSIMAASTNAADHPLAGVTVCMLTATDVVNDGRIRKEARALSAAGAIVTVVGQGGVVDTRLAQEPYHVILVPKTSTVPPRREPATSLGGRISQRLRREYQKFNKPTPPVVTAQFSNPGYAAAIDSIHPAVIHAHNVYTLDAAMAGAKRVGAKLIYDARELFDGYFLRVSPWPVERQSWSDRMERLALKRADGVITVSPLIERHLAARCRRSDIEVIYNSLPYAELDPVGVHAPVRIVNQGSQRETTHDHLIVEAMVHLRDIATLTVQGRFQRPEYRAQVEEFIAEHNLGDVVTLAGEYDPLESIALAHCYDVGVGVYRADTVSKDLTLANRFFTYLNAGVALAMPDVAAHREFPGYEDLGVLVDTTSAESIATSLRPLLEDPERIARLKLGASAAASAYSWEVQQVKLLAVYRRVLGR